MEPEIINPISEPATTPEISNSKKPSLLLFYLLFIVVILGIASGVGVYLKREGVKAGIVDTSKNELELISKIKDNWPQIKVDTVSASGYSIEKSGNINDLYKKVQDADRYEGGGPNGGPNEIQFIGKSNFIVKVYFQDGVYFSVFNYENGKFKLLETKGSGNFISEAEWQDIIRKYGDSQYPFSSYTTVVFRYLKSDSQAEYVYFDTLTKVPENVFITGYWDLNKQSDTSTWKTYRNEDYGFEFKYPEEAVIPGTPVMSGNTIILEIGMSNGIFILPKGESDYGYDEQPIISDVEIGGLKAKKQFWESDQRLEYKIIDPAKNWIPCGKDLKNCNIISIQWETKEQLEFLNQILSTFKFISEKYKVVNDSFMGDGKLIEVNSDGSEKVIIPSFKAIAPRESYHYFEKLSFPENSNNLYFYTFLDGTDAPPGGVYSYNLLTKELRRLTNISEYYSNYGSKFLSPNGRYLASIVNPHQYSNKQIFLLDLENDKVTPIVTLTGKESITFCSVSGDCWDNQGDIKWINNNTIEYKIYDSSYFGEQTIYDYPEMDKRIFSF